MLDPNKINKYLYIEKTPTWKVRALYSFGIVSWLLVLWGFSGAVMYDPFYRYFVGPILVILTIYQLSSFVLNLFYRQFDLNGHLLWVKVFWIMHGGKPPSVDIFLPICGEDISILRNTWQHVSRLTYKNKRVYVLDDSKEDCAAHKALAEHYGFIYLERPNKGEMKKAGNLKFGFEHSKGDFIAIFDADFAPHPDFLIETLPYMNDRKVGIVQTPQYFETTKQVQKRSPLEYGAAYVQEDFYRIIQVARDRLGGALCCGSNAIYRRSALRTIGGPFQVRYSEDSRTGVALVSKGWLVRYVPIILALGLCPHNSYGYFHQQHRWCSGSMELLSSKKEFWSAPMPIAVRSCYLSGFAYYLHHPFMVLISFQLLYTLIFYNDYISLYGAVLFYPYLMFSFMVLPLFHIVRLRRGIFTATMTQVWAFTHAIMTVIFFRRSVSWIPTNLKHTHVSTAFKQTMIAVGTYVAIYVFFILFAAFLGFVHLFDVNYYSVQFWLFYNLALSVFLFWQMYVFYRSRKRSG